MLLTAVVLLPLWPPARTTILSAALVVELLDLGPRPLSLFAAEPRRETTSYGEPADRLDLYVPYGASAANPVPAVVLELGVHPPPLDDAAVTGVARAISRLGVVVAVPDSAALRGLVVSAAEPSHLADAYLLVAARPDVDPARVGLAGFSAGASIALAAAADDRIAAEVRFVSAFGGYASAERLLVDVATRTSQQGDSVVPWPPDSGIRRDVIALAINALSDEVDRTQLRYALAPVIEGADPATAFDAEAAGTLSGEARQIYDLFTSPSRQAAQAAVAGLSPGLRDELAAISPDAFADRVLAPVYILHGRPDTAIPVVHAALIAQAIGDNVAELTLFGEFGHGQPGEGGIAVDDIPDVVSLGLYLRSIVAATLE